MATAQFDPITVIATGVTPELVGGDLPEGLTFKDGKITGTPTQAGKSKVAFTTKDDQGNVIDTREVTIKIAEKKEINEKCIATSVGFGLPLLALIPLGLATRMHIPGLSEIAAQATARIQDVNTQIQQQAGLFNPEAAVRVDEINKPLGQFGLNVGTLEGGLALLAAGILAGTIDSTDKTDANFKLDPDGDGTPDSKDDDDDNDGISDKEEKDKGSIPATPLEPGTKRPDWDDASTTPDKPMTIEKDPSSGEFTPGSTVEVTDGPGSATVDDKGTITVTPNEDAKPGDKIVVEVKDPNGKVINTVTVEIVKNQAQQFIPNYEDLTKVEVDKTNDTNIPFGDQKAPLKNIDSKPSAGSQDWEFKMQDNGVITATAPTMDEVGKAVGEQLPAIDNSWEKFVETFTPYARPSVIVDFTYQDDSNNTDTANFDLLGKDGKSLLDPDGDFDGDGYTNKEEIEGGFNPADPTSKLSEGPDLPEDTTAPAVNPIKPGDETVSGTGDRPNEDVIVELPGGKKVETTTDDKGNWTIEVPADVDLQPGQNVAISDGAGNKTTAKVGIDTGKCVATSLGFGLPLLALIPLGLASQMEIPGLSDVVGQANAQLQAANTQIQQ